MATVKGYSSKQIALHWIVAVLIVFQLIFGEDMGTAWRSFENGEPVVMGTAAWAHILVGIAVLALAIWRLEMRWMRGAPEAPAGTPARSAMAAAVGHAALYGLMLVAPITGLLAWYGGISVLAEVHEWLKPLFILFILGHVAAALYHHFVVKDGLLDRMRRPLD